AAAPAGSGPDGKGCRVHRRAAGPAPRRRGRLRGGHHVRPSPRDDRRLTMGDPEGSKAFLGVGWGFPVGLVAGGDVSTAAYEDDVAQAVRIILATRRGGRGLRPDFGAGLDAPAFPPITARTHA